MNTRQIRIFFRFSKVIRQFLWLFPCFVKVANPFVNLKLHLCYITLRIYRNQNKNNLTLPVQLTNLIECWNEHRLALEILKKIWICLEFIQLYVKRRSTEPGKNINICQKWAFWAGQAGSFVSSLVIYCLFINKQT